MALFKCHSNLFIQTAATAPQQLIKGLVERARELEDIILLGGKGIRIEKVRCFILKGWSTELK